MKKTLIALAAAAAIATGLSATAKADGNHRPMNGQPNVTIDFGFGFGSPGFGHPGFGRPGFGHPGFGFGPHFGHRRWANFDDEDCYTRIVKGWHWEHGMKVYGPYRVTVCR